MAFNHSEQLEINSQGQVKVIEVVLDKMAYGWSAEEIHLQHPHL